MIVIHELFKNFYQFFIGSSIVNDCVHEHFNNMTNSSLVHVLFVNKFQDLFISKKVMNLIKKPPKYRS